MSAAIEAAGGAREIFVLPTSLEWSVWQREAFGRTLAEFRREHARRHGVSR